MVWSGNVINGAGGKKFLKFSESMAVKYSDVIITDNKAIDDYVDAEYSKNNVVIAYGDDHVIVEGLEIGLQEGVVA
jgi:hypothetical protein